MNDVKIEIHPAVKFDTHRVFDEMNRYWEKHPEYNMLTLKSIQNHLNDLLQTRGHVFLNEVYDKLGFKRTPEGQLIGWLMNGDGANYIDFGLYESQMETTSPITLKFNVDGIIYDKI